MPRIELNTVIIADIEIVFDLSRSIDLHVTSTSHTNEKAIAGKTAGLINLGETVTWEAKHLGVYQKLTSKITKFERPYSFTDEMQEGAFKYLKHDHIFVRQDNATLMKDIFIYKSPLGILGNLADVIFLKKYLTDLLIMRNTVIKEYAESDKWKELM